MSVPEGLSPSTRDSFLEYVQGPPRSRDSLKKAVKAHLTEAKLASENSDLLDLETARRLADGLTVLLEESGDDALRLLQGAVLYFVDDDDAESDFDSITGFDDDVEVYNAVCRHLKRDELVIIL